MKHFRVYKNLNEYEIVEAKSVIEAQWSAGFMPFRTVECDENGNVKVPEHFKKVEPKQNK